MAGRVIYAVCGKCLQEDIEFGKIPGSVTYKLANPNNDIDHIEFRCENGHQNIIFTDEVLFETLLNIATEDMIIKHYREAVFNFASAQERFFEFAIELLCFQKGYSKEEYDKMWKLLPLSERQLGAFCALYFCEFGQSPLDQKKYENMAKIRNTVIHQGRTPSREDAEKYGNYVVENIYNIMKNLLENIERKIIFDFKSKKQQESREKKKKLPDGYYLSVLSNSVVPWTALTSEQSERENRLRDYSLAHTSEYSDMACKANETGKVLDVDNKGNLILIDPPDFFADNSKVEYIGKASLSEYIMHVVPLLSHYVSIEKGFVEGFRVVDLTRV